MVSIEAVKGLSSAWFMFESSFVKYAVGKYTFSALLFH